MQTVEGGCKARGPLPAPCQHHTLGHLILAPKQGERWKKKKVEEREPTSLQISPLQLILSVAILTIHPLPHHPLSPPDSCFPPKVHISPVLIIIIFSGCRQERSHTAGVFQASVGATPGGEWRRDTFPCLCQDVLPMHLPDPTQALGNPKPWAHLHTSHLLWMPPPEKPRRAQSRVEGSLGALPHVPVCAVTVCPSQRTPQGEQGEKREAPELLFALPWMESGLGSRDGKLQALARRIWLTSGNLPRREGLGGLKGQGCPR